MACDNVSRKAKAQFESRGLCLSPGCRAVGPVGDLSGLSGTCRGFVGDTVGDTVGVCPGHCQGHVGGIRDSVHVLHLSTVGACRACRAVELSRSAKRGMPQQHTAVTTAPDRSQAHRHSTLNTNSNMTHATQLFYHFSVITSEQQRMSP